MKKYLLATAAIFLLAGGLVMMARLAGRVETAAPPTEPGREILYWTCAMHPEVRMPEFGQSPICGMDLIPVYADDEEDEDERGAPVLRLSERAAALAEVETAPVARRHLAAEIRALGRVGYDETRQREITAWVPGRIEELYRNFLGDRVEKGEPLFRIYSPELRTAQEEYLIAARRLARARTRSDEEEIAAAEQVRAAVAGKMELWGLSPEQVAAIGERGAALDRLDFHAPASGVIIEREVYEGRHVRTGDRLFHLAELDTVWVQLDVYEKDLAHVRPGQAVAFEAEARPGETFTGRVAFVSPYLDETTRTVRVRLEMPNPAGDLKPGMFGTALLGADLGHHQLSIPATAALLTGKRAVVYVETAPRRYEGREVRLGPRAGDYFTVLEGLHEGERVVTRGNFKIDAAMQIRARPSMMRPSEAAGAPAAPPGHAH